MEPLGGFVLCRHGDSGGYILGAARGSSAAEILCTVQHDGIVAYDVSSQRRVRSWALGDRKSRFVTAAVWDERSQRCFVAVESGSRTEVISFKADSGLSLDKAPERFDVEGGIVALFPATSHVDGGSEEEGEDPGGVVAVLTDAQVVWFTPAGDENARISLAGKGGPLPVVQLASMAPAEGVGQEMVVVAAEGGQGKRGGDDGLVAHVVRVRSPAGLQDVGRVELCGAGRAPAKVAATGGGDMAVLWEGGQWEAFKSAGGSFPATACLALQNVTVSPAGGAGGARSSTGGGRKDKKRRAPSGGSSDVGASEGPGVGVAMSGIGDSYVAIAAPLGGGVPGSVDLEITLLDTAYGCVHRSLHLADEDDGEAGAGGAVQVLSLPAEYADTLVVVTRGAISVAELELPELSLAAVVGARGASGAGSVRATAAERVLGREQCEALARPPQTAVAQPVWGKAVMVAGEEPGSLEGLPAESIWDGRAMDAAEQRDVAAVAMLSDPSKTPTPAQFAARVQSLVTTAGESGLSPCVVAAAVGRAVEGGYWVGLRALVDAGQVSAVAPHTGLVAALLEAHQLPLLQRLLAGTHDLPAADISRVLVYLLAPPSAPRRDAAAAAAAGELRAAAEELVDAAVGLPAGGEGRRQMAAAAAAAAAAADRFPAHEQCLHSLVASPLDATTVHSALRRLQGGAPVLALLDYLGRWIALYAGELNYVAGCEGAAEGRAASSLIPSSARVVEWAGAVLDAHFTQLALLPGAREVAVNVQATVAHQVRACRKFTPLHGIASHVKRKAALPPPHGSASAAYSIELLDLC